MENKNILNFEGVLFLEKMGCDFWKDEPIKSDVNNYRVRTHGEIIPGKDGNIYFLEFHLWRNRYKIRLTNRKTGQPLKHPVKEIVNPCGVAIDTEFTNERGSWHNCKLEERLYKSNYSYNCKDILKIVNRISTQKFNKIIFADMAAIQKIPDILKIAGYREKNIIDNLKEVKYIKNNNYIIYRFFGDDGNCFDYELTQHKITG